MKPIIAIDPGTTESAILGLYNGEPSFGCYGIFPNEEILKKLEDCYFDRDDGVTLVIEGVACYGMPVGKETFQTCVWIGRFIQNWVMSGPGFTDEEWHLLYRPDIKMHLCHTMRAKDPHIRQALIDRFGPGKNKAIGKKATPGPLYGIKSHLWSALALACTWWDLNKGD